MKNRIRLSWALPALVASFLLAQQPCPAASLEELVTSLRQFTYGQDPSPLTSLEREVAAATALPGESDRRRVLAESLASVLEADASYESKQFVCRQLAIIGTAQQAPILAKLLVDPKFSDMARYALGPIPGAAVDDVLESALERTNGKTRIGIMDTLAYRRDSRAVGSLGKLLDAADAECAQAAASALGRIGGSEAASFLKRAFAQQAGRAWFDTADAYMASAETLQAQKSNDLAALIYQEIFTSTASSWTRSAALRGLVATERDGARFATAALREKDPVIVKAAIGCLQLVQGTEATRAFAAELGSLAPAAQTLLLHALADRADGAALSAVKIAAGSVEPGVRLAALQALGKLGDRSSVELLVTAAGGAPNENAVALASLRSMRGEGVDAAITQAMEQAQPQLRAQLIGILSDRRAQSSVPALLRLAGGSDPAVASESFKALGQTAQPIVLPALLKLLTSPPPESVRDLAEEAVIAVSRRIPDLANQADLVLAALRTEKDALIRRSLVRVLGGIGAPGGLEAVQRALNDDDEAVRDAAVRALADWPNPAATEPLFTVFDHAANGAHRALALRGLIRLSDPALNQQPPSRILSLYQRLMPKLKDPDEIRLALSGLANVNDPQALRLAAPHLEIEPTKEEAAAAMVKIASATAAADPDAARKASQLVLAVSSNPAIRKQATSLLDTLDK